MRKIGNAEARRLFLQRHLLADPPTGPAKGAALTDLITRLGFVQVDSIRTVERAHHMILFARRQRYRPADLAPLLERDRTLFEHWTHDAAILPMAFYPHWRLRFARDTARLHSRWEKWRRDGFTDKIDTILARIRDEGPCGSADVGLDEARSKGGWWDWHPSKTALEYLWRTGKLAVTRREAFRKIFDLSDRVVPSAIFGQHPDETETRAWLCHEALKRLGFATPGEIAAFWDCLRPAECKDWAETALKLGQIEPILVQGADGHYRQALAAPDLLQASIPDPPGRMRVLSPFDPALRDRKRAERLFGFHYRIEVFVPAAKRRYGYYVFPLLEGSRLIGRIDMKADRKTGMLMVTALWPETGNRWSPARQARLEAELTRVARFAGLEQVQWLPGWERSPLLLP